MQVVSGKTFHIKEPIMGKLFVCILFAVALVAFWGIASNAEAQYGHNHSGYSHGGWGGGTYYPSHPGAPMYSYYTGDYGRRYSYVPAPNPYRYPPTRYYAPSTHYYTQPRYYAPTQYYAPPPIVYRGGRVDVGPVHVQW
jgi:hypothetical protein